MGTKALRAQKQKQRKTSLMPRVVASRRLKFRIANGLEIIVAPSFRSRVCKVFAPTKSGLYGRKIHFGAV